MSRRPQITTDVVNAPHPATRNRPCPGLLWGQGRVSLSNQRLQLIFVQCAPEFPFYPFGHLLPRSSRGFHRSQHRQCLCQGAILIGIGLPGPEA